MIIGYNIITIGAYTFGSIGFILQAYIGLRSASELIVSKSNIKKSLENWKFALNMCRDGFILLKSNEIIYHNTGIDTIISSHKINTGSIGDNVLFSII